MVCRQFSRTKFSNIFYLWLCMKSIRVPVKPGSLHSISTSTGELPIPSDPFLVDFDNNIYIRYYKTGYSNISRFCYSQYRYLGTGTWCWYSMRTPGPYIRYWCILTLFQTCAKSAHTHTADPNSCTKFSIDLCLFIH